VGVTGLMCMILKLQQDVPWLSRNPGVDVYRRTLEWTRALFVIRIVSLYSWFLGKKYFCIYHLVSTNKKIWKVTILDWSEKLLSLKCF
jgi:hypothetical protein